MRNILVHDYGGVDLEIVWGVLDLLPDLRVRIEAVLGDLRQPSPEPE